MSALLSKNHPTRLLADAVAKRCETLLDQSNIHMLSYSKLSSATSSGYMLYSNEAFYDFRGKSAVPYAPFYLKAGVYDWEDIFPRELIEGARAHNIDRAINIILENDSGEKEIASFYVDSDTPFSKSLILSNVEWLKSLVGQFRENAQDLIQKVAEQPVVIPSHLTQRPMNFAEVDVDLQGKKWKALYAKLSTQEQACMDALRMGKEVNEIAVGMKIQPTSVYTYINRIKQKLGCDKNTLFKLARQKGWENLAV